MQKDFYIYPAISHYAEDGISISFPNLAGCLSCAQTDEEALLMAKDVLKGYLVVCEEDGDEIPHPTP
ncbi:MAG: type II toxin-antitoxin system HicB family antitoxin, partial [Hyphomonadaceae bacterium]|nr:type II toxin-antitoxin system HicB family antitoxin [Clostridia bacterium]